MPGKNADQRADQAAEKGVPEIVGLEGDAKSMRQTDEGVFPRRRSLIKTEMPGGSGDCNM